MKLYVTFKQQNSDFDKKYAQKFNFGRESDGNRRDNWSIGYKISDSIKEFTIIENGEFHLIGSKAGEPFDYAIPEMIILNCLTVDNELIKIAVSKKLINKTQSPHNSKYNTTRFYFYLNNNEFINPIDTVFISKSDCPKELLKVS